MENQPIQPIQPNRPQVQTFQQAPVPVPAPPINISSPSASRHPLSIIALILSCVSILIPLFPIISLVLGVVALRLIKKQGRSGKKLSIIAIVISAITLILQVLLGVQVQNIASKLGLVNEQKPVVTKSSDGGQAIDDKTSNFKFVAPAGYQKDTAAPLGQNSVYGGSKTDSIQSIEYILTPDVPGGSTQYYGVTTESVVDINGQQVSVFKVDYRDPKDKLKVGSKSMQYSVIYTYKMPKSINGSKTVSLTYNLYTVSGQASTATQINDFLNLADKTAKTVQVY